MSPPESVESFGAQEKALALFVNMDKQEGLITRLG